MFLTLLPFLSSGFVPTDTMPVGLRQFAEYEPFTPVTQTVRGMLTDNPIGTHAIVAVAWSAGIAIACYFWGRPPLQPPPRRGVELATGLDRLPHSPHGKQRAEWAWRMLRDVG